MSKIVHDPLSGFFRIHGKEHLGSYTDKKSAKEAHRNEENHLKSLSYNYGKEHAESGRSKDEASLEEGYYHKGEYNRGYKEHQKPEWGDGK